jgi:hypothetical protein
MMNLRNRIAKLEAQCGGPGGAGQSVIFVAGVHPDGGSVVQAALLMGGGAILRGSGEPEESFIDRAMKAAERAAKPMQ